MLARHLSKGRVHPKNRRTIMIEQNLEIPTADGVTEALLVRPESNDPLPAIINLTDGLGFRPAFAEQSKRIAEQSLVVGAMGIVCARAGSVPRLRAAAAVTGPSSRRRSKTDLDIRV